VNVKEDISASNKLGAEKALELAKTASRIIVMKGKKVSDFDMKKDKPSQDELLSLMLGATGNLRAPTIVRGKTVLVGFNPDVFDEILG
jgi:arsenate reductase-like glutaredoxin family protein